MDGLILASDDKSVKLWNVVTGVTMRSVELEAEVKFLVSLPDHRLLASCNMGHIYVIDTSSGDKIKIDTSAVPVEYVARPIVCVDVGGQDYVIAPRSGFIDVYGVKSGKLEKTFKDDLKGKGHSESSQTNTLLHCLLLF